MASFTHNPDDYILIDNLVMPLSFWLTQEPAYLLPSGMITQNYIQGERHSASDGETQVFYSIPWATGDTYISNKVTYEAAYAAYLVELALPKTIPLAKSYMINSLHLYWAEVNRGGVIYDSTTYHSTPIERDHWKEELEYANRNSALLTSHYVYDIDYNKINLLIAELNDLLDKIDEFYWETRQNFDYHREQINLLTTIVDILAYDFTTGWPTTPYT